MALDHPSQPREVTSCLADASPVSHRQIREPEGLAQLGLAHVEQRVDRLVARPIAELVVPRQDRQGYPAWRASIEEFVAVAVTDPDQDDQGDQPDAAPTYASNGHRSDSDIDDTYGEVDLDSALKNI